MAKAKKPRVAPYFLFLVSSATGTERIVQVSANNRRRAFDRLKCEVGEKPIIAEWCRSDSRTRPKHPLLREAMGL
jgi:hypothetical protein